jgi:hypothetical protein
MESARGPTRPETRLSEAESYVNLAEAHKYWGLLPASDSKERVIVEKRALDSYHNLVFSITKFYEVTSTWPTHITIISNEFKRARFLDLHRLAIGWPSDKVSFVGIDPPYMMEDLVRAKNVRQGERRNGFEAWQWDMNGTRRELEEKRTRRNPWYVSQTLFENEDVRDRSGVQYAIHGQREVLCMGPQPWSP